MEVAVNGHSRQCQVGVTVSNTNITLLILPDKFVR